MRRLLFLLQRELGIFQQNCGQLLEQESVDCVLEYDEGAVSRPMWFGGEQALEG